MEPTFKSPKIKELLDSVGNRTEAITNNRCINKPIGCGQPANTFRDDLSKREFRISGLCQSCQDKVFGK